MGNDIIQEKKINGKNIHPTNNYYLSFECQCITKNKEKLTIEASASSSAYCPGRYPRLPLAVSTNIFFTSIFCLPCK